MDGDASTSVFSAQTGVLQCPVRKGSIAGEDGAVAKRLITSNDVLNHKLKCANASVVTVELTTPIEVTVENVNRFNKKAQQS